MNSVLIAEQVVHLNSRKPHSARVHRELCAVKRIKIRAVAKLLAERVVAARCVDFAARVVGEFNGFRVKLLSVEREILPRQIQRNHQQIARRGGLREVYHLSDVVRVYGFCGEENCALRERAARFVNGNGSHIRAAAHTAWR